MQPKNVNGITAFYRERTRTKVFYDSNFGYILIIRQRNRRRFFLQGGNLESVTYIVLQL